MKYIRLFLLTIGTAVSTVFLTNCSSGENEQAPLFRLLTPNESGIAFNNILQETSSLNILNYEYMYNGAGVGIGDINNDGLPDVFFAGNMVPCQLYLNKGDLTFEDITASAGIRTEGKWATGVSMVDINADGWLDIYVCFSGPYGRMKRMNQLYINQRNGTFKEQAQECGLADYGHSIQAAFFDCDKDGDLDMYLLTNTAGNPGPNVIRAKQLNGENINTDRLYRNDGGKFINVSAEAGILKEGYGLGVAVTDINRDGWPDIYVSNDYLSNDLLYLNQKDGTFWDVAEDAFAHTSYSAMGNDVVDLNGDGWQEVIALDMLPPDNKRRKLMFNSINYDRHRSEILTGYSPQYPRNTLQLNRGLTPEGIPAFSEIGQLAGIHSTDWSWSVLSADYDLDGEKDLMITNGYPRDIINLDFVAYKMSELSQTAYGKEPDLFLGLDQIEGALLPNYLFKGEGEFGFKDVSEKWGFVDPAFSHGAAMGDLDRDGDLDVVINNTYSAAFVYENQSERLPDTGHYLQLELHATEKNPMGLGAQIWLWQDQVKKFYEHRIVRGFQSSMDPIIHFGLGKKADIDSLVIVWPDGNKQVLAHIKADSLYQIEYRKGTTLNAPSKTLPLLVKANIPGLEARHIEQHYPDVKVQPLLPHSFSQCGPGMSIGDLNGDGLLDLYMGGGFRQAGTILSQQKNGSFKSSLLSIGENFEEELGTLIFDADGDGDQDLFLASGSSEFEESSIYYQDRLFYNDGKGNFSPSTEALPQYPTSSSCVLAADYDRDGDLDLFVGGLLIPNAYPTSPASSLLENRGGTFHNVSLNNAPELAQAGMVKGGLWTDVNQDCWVDLILVGEWMSAELYLNEQGKLRKSERPLTPEGWWYSVQGSDLDNDGDIDYVLGNHGINSPFHITAEQPLTLYLKDFDGDQKLDPVMTQWIEEIEYPFHFKDDMVQQMFGIKKKYSTYTPFAEASWEDMFSPELRQSAERYQAKTHKSLILENTGDGNVKTHELPFLAQLAPLKGIMIKDLNQDYIPDLILGGNSFATETHTGRYDASRGLVLLGNGDLTYSPMSILESGLNIQGDMMSLVELPLADQHSLMVFSQNNDHVVSFKVEDSPKMRWWQARDLDKEATIYLKDGKNIFVEFYYGGGYLSQSARGIWINEEVMKIEVVSFDGLSRTISFNE